MFAARNMLFAGGFNPLSLSPALWLSDTGSDLSIWPDLSGNSRNATQATAGYQPSIQAGVLNGRQVRRFDGVDDFLVTPALGFTSLNLTIFIVHKFSEIPSSKGRLLLGNNDFANLDKSSGLYNMYAGGTGMLGLFSVTTNYTLATCRYVSVGNGSQLFINGDLKATGNPGTGYPSFFYIGSRSDLFHQSHLGDIAEILVFPTSLSEANRRAVENYLNSKWAIY